MHIFLSIGWLIIAVIGFFILDDPSLGVGCIIMSHLHGEKIE